MFKRESNFDRDKELDLSFFTPSRIRQLLQDDLNNTIDWLLDELTLQFEQKNDKSSLYLGMEYYKIFKKWQFSLDLYLRELGFLGINELEERFPDLIKKIK